ncbi:MAG: DUF3426 domain-containing protein [Comamonadaceae bacterium]|nr:DUF3426 domain-containing protein [Comamonadaceae bacterium]
MSLLTRCPACLTHFRLVPDQLRLSQGWVRCGQCEEIFDASLNLIHAALAPEEEPGQSAAAEAPNAQLVDAASDVPEASHCLGNDESTDVVTIMDHADADPPSALSLAVADLPEAGVDTSAASDAIPQVKDVPSRNTLADLTDRTEFEDHKPLNGVPELGTDHVSFLRESDRAPFGSSKVGRALLWWAALCLLFILLVQWLYWDRDRLATVHSELKPALQAYCRLMNCKIRAVKRVEAVSIDSATFNKSGPENYRLSFTIKNLSGLALAWPSIELTLTDIQDQVTVRRVFSPAELFVTDEDLLAGSDRSVSVVMKIDASQTISPIMGYRLLAFYP